MPRGSELAGVPAPWCFTEERPDFIQLCNQARLGISLSLCLSSCIGRRILNHWTAREALASFFFFKARFRGFVFPWKNQLCSGSLPGERTVAQPALGPTHASISLYCSVGATRIWLKDESRSCKSGHLLYHLIVEVFPRASLISLLS